MNIWSNLTDLFNDNDIVNEMSKKYRNTVLALKKDKRETYATYKGFEGFHEFRDENDVALRLAVNTDCQVTIPIIQRGLYNTKTGAVFASRIPYRQYRKGLSKESIQICTLSDFAFRNGAFNGNQPVNRFGILIFDVLNRKDITYKLEEALQMLSKYGSVAMTRDFGIALPHTDMVGDVALWMGCYHIGAIDTKSKTIHVINTVFHQEVLDSMHTWCNQEYKVI